MVASFTIILVGEKINIQKEPPFLQWWLTSRVLVFLQRRLGQDQLFACEEPPEGSVSMGVLVAAKRKRVEMLRNARGI